VLRSREPIICSRLDLFRPAEFDFGPPKALDGPHLGGYSAAVVGVDAFEVEIEVDAGWGNPDKFAVVGLPDTAVKESKDRVTSAICNNGLRWPYGKRITINLAPADVRKEGASFDLPIAVGMLKLEENDRLPALDAYCITGELALRVNCVP
jgi:magnesium chelatase family protein